MDNLQRSENKNGNIYFGMAVMGAAVGATITAGAIALSDSKIRKKLIKTFQKLKTKTMETVDQMKEKQANDLQENGS